MQHRAADHDVERLVLERHPFHGLDAKAVDGKRWCQCRGLRARRGEGALVSIVAPDVEPAPVEIHEIPPSAAPGVEDLHALGDSSAMELIEQINVDVAELAAK